MTPRETLEHWQRIGRKVVHEADAKDLLGQIGVPVPERDPAGGPASPSCAMTITRTNPITAWCGWGFPRRRRGRPPPRCPNGCPAAPR